MADEKDFREPDGATQDYELDEVFELAFEIDAFLRAHNLKYRTKFPMEQRQREILADKMLESDTFYIKHLISSVLGHEGDALMNRLNAYETEFRKNQYSVYHLKSDYDKKCGYSLKSEREKGNYINKDMYEIVRSEPLEQYKTPMEIDVGLMINKAAGAAVYQPDLRDIIVINYDGQQKAYFKGLKEYTEAPEFTGVHITSAALNNYKGLTAFLGKDGNVYLGKSERNLYNSEKKSLPFYNNSDNSLTFISDNKKMFSFLCGSGWVLSQSEMIENGAFTKSDYQEFAELQKGVLSKFEPIREITFNGEPFNYPDYNRNIEQTAEKQKNEKGVLKNMNDYKFAAFIVNRSEYDNGNRETSGTELSFPTDAETVKRTFAEIGLPENASPDTYFFDDYACGNDDLKKCLTMYESVDALNYFAMRISELEDTEMTVFQTALKAGECKNITDAINITYNMEYYNIVDNLSNWADYGKYIAHRDMLDERNMNYEEYGKHHAYDHGGYLLDGIVLETGWTEFDKVYDGKNIPDEYRVTVPTEPQKMTVLIVPPMQEPYIKEISTGLEALQKEVGGRIEVVYPFAEPVGLICNDEGKNERMELNRALYDAEDNMYDIIAGTFVLAGLSGDNFGSLDKDQIKQFSERFAKPEMFMRINGKITAVEVKPSIKAKLDRLQKEQNNTDKPQPQKKPREETL